MENLGQLVGRRFFPGSELLLSVIFAETVGFLDAAGQFNAVAVDAGHVVVGELAPFCWTSPLISFHWPLMMSVFMAISFFVAAGLWPACSLAACLEQAGNQRSSLFSACLERFEVLRLGVAELQIHVVLVVPASVRTG